MQRKSHNFCDRRNFTGTSPFGEKYLHASRTESPAVYIFHRQIFCEFSRHVTYHTYVIRIFMLISDHFIHELLSDFLRVYDNEIFLKKTQTKYKKPSQKTFNRDLHTNAAFLPGRRPLFKADEV